MSDTLSPADFYACWKLLDLKNAPSPTRVRRHHKNEDCMRCIECLDKKKYGGQGVRKRSCINKQDRKTYKDGEYIFSYFDNPLVLKFMPE